MSRRIFTLVILALLGFVGSGIIPSYAQAAPQTVSQEAVKTRPQINPQSNLQSAPRATSTASTIDITITSVGNPTIREGEKLHVEARIANKSDSSLTLAAQLRAHSEGFSTRNHLLAFIGETTSAKDTSDKLVTVTQNTQSLTLAAHSEQTLVLEAEPAKLRELGWSSEKWGPRGVEVYVSSGQGLGARDRSFITLEPAKGIKPMPTGVAVALTDSRSELSDLYGAESLTQIRTQPTKRMENLAASMSMKGVSVFADPAYADLSKAPQTIMTASANADILALLDLQHKDLAQSLMSKSFKTGNIPVRINSLGSAESFATYKDLGASAFILDSSWCRSEQKNYANPAAHTLLEIDGNTNRGGNDSVKAQDITVDVLLNDAESARVIAEAPNVLQARQNAVALSAMTYLEQPSIIRPQLLYFDLADDEIWKVDAQGRVVRDYSQLAEATSALMNAPWVQEVQISDLLDTPATGSVHLSTDAIKAYPSHLSKQTLSSIDMDIQEASKPANLVTSPTEVLAPVNTAATHLYSQNWQGAEKAYNRALKNFTSLTNDYSNSVSATSVSTINLVAEKADIPVRVQNKLSVPATVSVTLDSIDARLIAENPVNVELPPASTTTVSIPVTARGSGNVQAQIRLHDESGMEVGNPTTVEVRVRAGWENTATAVAAILVTFMLIIGIIRSIRGGRRSKSVNPQDYTQARRNTDLALADNSRKIEMSPHS